jgi:hypothetical protein
LLAPHDPLPICRLRKHSPRLAEKSLTANVIVFMFMTTKRELLFLLVAAFVGLIVPC